MKTLLSGIAGAVVLAVIAAYVLSVAQEPVYQVYTSSSARVDQPGSNLVRPWARGGRPAESASGSPEGSAPVPGPTY